MAAAEFPALQGAASQTAEVFGRVMPLPAPKCCSATLPAQPRGGEDVPKRMFVPPRRVSAATQHLNLLTLDCTTLGLQGWEIGGTHQCSLFLAIGCCSTAPSPPTQGRESSGDSSWGLRVEGRGPSGRCISLSSSVSLPSYHRKTLCLGITEPPLCYSTPQRIQSGEGSGGCELGKARGDCSPHDGFCL